MDLFNIGLSKTSIKLLNTAKKLGLEKPFQKLIIDALDISSDYCKDAVKSVIPVDTEDLRNKSFIKYIRRRYSSLVLITPDTHTGRGRPKPASELARMLQEGHNEQGKFMRRTRHSLPALAGATPIARRTPTRGWKGKAEALVEKGLQNYLNKTLSGMTYK